MRPTPDFFQLTKQVKSIRGDKSQILHCDSPWYRYSSINDIADDCRALRESESSSDFSARLTSSKRDIV